MEMQVASGLGQVHVLQQAGTASVRSTHSATLADSAAGALSARSLGLSNLARCRRWEHFMPTYLPWPEHGGLVRQPYVMTRWPRVVL